MHIRSSYWSTYESRFNKIQQDCHPVQWIMSGQGNLWLVWNVQHVLALWNLPLWVICWFHFYHNFTIAIYTAILSVPVLYYPLWEQILCTNNPRFYQYHSARNIYITSTYIPPVCASVCRLNLFTILSTISASWRSQCQ